MKLHRLELQGFGPFLHRQLVDFDAFDDDGIFLITGRTGAGKSSILDGVSFALYGAVPRYEGGDKRIRSDHSAPDDLTEVRLEFTIDGRRLAVTRSPDYEKPKKRGEGLTPVAHAARLDELIDGEWVTLAAKPREVGNLLSEILGLTQQQFLQVILLAQNRFAQFLLAKNDERQALLRTLFGSRAYGEYQAALEQRRKSAEQSLARGSDEVRLLLDEAGLLIEDHGLGGDRAGDDSSDRDTAWRLGDLERSIERAEYRVETRDRDRDVADDAQMRATAAHAALEALVHKQAERTASRAALALLEAEEPAVADDRARLDGALRAEGLRTAMDAATRARLASERALATQLTVTEAWAAVDGEDATDADALRGRIDMITGELARWSDAADQERELDALDSAVQKASAAEAVLLADQSSIAERLAGVPARREELDRRHGELADAAVALETARARADAVAAALAAAREAAAREDALRAADAAHLDRSAAFDAAAAEVTALLRRRMNGYAAELATELVDGEACAVCGSHEHPAPAVHTGDPVTEDAIAQAESARERAAAADREAAALARAARTAHAEAAGRAGGETVGTLERMLAEADATRAGAEATDLERVAVSSERERIDAQEREIGSELVECTARLAALRRDLGVAADRAASARAAVDRARGDFASVAERVTVARRVRERAVALAAALDESASRDALALEAEADRDERVAASDFGDVANVIAALLDASTRENLGERMREHDVSQRAERDRLRTLELDLAGQPESPIDLNASAAAVVSTREAVRAATEAASRAAEAVDRLRALAARAQRAHEASAELSAEYEVIAGLALALSGRTASRMDLETFVLAAELEEIIVAANLRLSEMSSGRYLLQHTDAVAARNAASGLGIEIIDAFTGRSRPAQSLSGGETFLASLALALGLAEVVTARAGGLRLDTLFIDEGFGSLDAETLELAMNTLDELRQGGRTVGVISHVEAMKEQLPAQLVVTASPHGPSVIRQDASAAV